MENPEIYLSEFKQYLQKFERYNSMMEDFLTEEFSKKKEEFKIDEFYRNPQKDFTELIDITIMVSDHLIFYPQNFRTSLLVQIFSVLEHKLGEICQIHHKKYKTDFSIKDLKGNSDIDKAKLYLKKACKLDFKKLDPEWNFLENLRKIRNIIVHSKGEINGKHRNWEAILNFIRSNNNILGFDQKIENMNKNKFQSFHKDNKNYKIEIKRYSCIELLLKNIEAFFEKLLNELAKK